MSFLGVSLPSLSDVKNAVTGAASSGLDTVENLGSSALSQAKNLGQQGVDLGRSALNEAGSLAGKADQAIQSAGTTATKAIGQAQSWAEHGITSGVTSASNGVHSAANYVRDHIPGSNPISNLARGAVTEAEDQTRFDIGFVGGVGNAAVGLVGSAGQLSVLSTEYQLSPSARTQINGAIGAKVTDGFHALSNYADSVAQNPSRLIGDAKGAASSASAWLRNEAAHPEQAGMTVGNAATYLIPVGGEARAVAGVGELATREVVGAVARDGTRAIVEDGTRAATEDGAKAITEDGARAATDGAALTANRATDLLLDASKGGAANLTDAVSALRQLSPAERTSALTDFVQKMDVSTPRDQAICWSGGVSTADGFQSSRGLAQTMSGVNLERTAGGGTLDALKLFDKSTNLVDDKTASELWDVASARFAEQARGRVTAVVENPRPASTWNRIEYPILQQGLDAGRVSSIDIVKPSELPK